MLFVGNQRGGGRDLALHLMKNENERVELHEIRGFASGDLESAFKESYAISRATRCKQHLFSLSINAPPIEDASNDDFLNAIERAEERLGLNGQPRAIVFHEKQGRDGNTRRHAHAVWCRIDTQEMKARQLSFSKSKLQDLSRELFLEHDWRMPPGMLHKPDRDPRKFTLEQWQQAKRAGKDPEKIIGIYQDCWSVSDSAASFAHALAEHGHVLAKGRRGFVAVDHDGEVYAVSKWTKRKAREVREKLGEPDDFPSVEQAHRQAAQMVTDRLAEIQAEQEQAEQNRLAALERERSVREAAQRVEREKLIQAQRERRQAEAQERAERLRSGLLGLLDRITGRRKATLVQNAQEHLQALERDSEQRAAVQSKHTERRQQNEQERVSVKEQFRKVQSELDVDIKRLKPSESEQQVQALEQRLSQNRQRRRTRNRNRDGPSFER